VGIDTGKCVDIGDLDVDVGIVEIAFWLGLLGIEGRECAIRRAIVAKVTKAVNITAPDANMG
jgi:hypothetical protein